jgi:hypothetical protein
MTLILVAAVPVGCLILIGAFGRQHPEPFRRFAAPAYALPVGCGWTEGREGLTRACDAPSAQIELSPDFDLPGPGKGRHWIRFGNDAVQVSCGWPGRRCNFLAPDYRANRFFQPTSAMIATLHANRTAYRGSPVELGPGLYGYPDMF